MVLPILGSILRSAASSAIRSSAVRTAARKVATQDVKLQNQVAKELHRDTVKAARKEAGDKAAKIERAKINEEIKKLGLDKKGLGAQRQAYRKIQSPRVTEARQKAQQAHDLKFNDTSFKGEFSQGVRSAVDEAFNAGNIAGAQQAIVDAARKAISRELNHLRTGRRLGHGTKVDVDNVSRDDLLRKTMEAMSEGQTMASAARKALSDYVRVETRKGSFVGKRALDLAVEAGRVNKELTKLKNITSLPASTQSKLMGELFRDNGDGTYSDSEGYVWTAEDVENYMRDKYEIDLSKVNSADPQDVIERARYQIRSSVSRHGGIVRSFATSLQSAGMAQHSPRLYNDIMEKVQSASPSELKSVVETGALGNSVSYFSSSSWGVIANLRKLTMAVGLDPSNYTDDELSW